MQSLLYFLICGLSFLMGLFCINLFKRDTAVIKITLLLILFPCFTLPVYLFNSLIQNNANPYFALLMPVVKFYVGFWATDYSPFILFSLFINIAYYIFCIKDYKNIRHFYPIWVSTFLLTLMLLIPDMFLSLAFHAMGELFFTFLLLFEEEDEREIFNLTNDFFWQRVSDLLAFMALLLIYLNQGNLFEAKILVNEPSNIFWPALLLFTSLMIRVLTTTYWQENVPKKKTTNVPLFNSIIFIIFGSFILLFKFSSIMFGHPILNIYFIATNAAFIIYFLFTVYKKSFKLVNWFYLVFFTINILICLKMNFIAIILSSLVISCGWGLFLINEKNLSIRYSASKIRLFNWILNFFYIIGRFFGRFIGPFYANFIWYRLPQIILGAFVILLRIFHQGNFILRGIFIILMLFIYVSYWSN